ncbi:MAG: hypothetical protein PHQ05_13815 [Sterolibacterium sp.]|nr:hypothetical protein [Sterolibacterium sp.]
MPQNRTRFAVTAFDYGLWRNGLLPEFLGGRFIVDFGVAPSNNSIRVGWGMKPSGQRAVRLALRSGGAFNLLEDGFLRSVDLGCREPPLSVVIDDLGIYYDASQPSRLEALIASSIDVQAEDRAAKLIDSWRVSRVSKYNHLREFAGRLPEPYVLVADQTLGDASIAYGMADAGRFSRMLEAALAENPDSTVVLKIHPDVFAGKKRGHFDPAALAGRPRVVVLAEDVHPVRLIEKAQLVYAVTSQLGFEALIWGKRVRTFGMPFYAGWGLTEDDLPAPDRRRPVTLVNLVHAALIDYPRYIDPETARRCEPERVIEWLGLQRRMRERFGPQLVAYDISQRKQPVVREFFQGSAVEFVAAGQAVPSGRDCIAWGRKPAPSDLSSSARVIRLEDGFLRSVGLGAEFVRPLSWVMDGRGIYYDATRTSDLEHILLTQEFDDALLKRASKLRQRIVESGLTKYNVGAGRWQRPATAGRVILVPGQVESDASIALGAPEGVCTVRRNIDLLQAVKQANPDAYVVYKPHPDVLAGLRSRGANESHALQWCDEQVVDIPMHVMLDCVDEVHLITSLTGFEALLRGRQVICYGQPFYAGWGLTEDKAPIARRTRRLTVDELVAGTLILYPTYVSRKTHRFTTPERALDELLEWRAEGGKSLSLWRRLYRLYLGFYRY